METISIDLLTRKLKNAPQSVLERVIGYVDALVEPATNTKPYSLSKEQQQILDSQLGSDKSTYTDAEKLYTDLKNKYEL
jgi:succinate dehydrogenase/fumarate reductase flavoprotein subunit